MWIWTQDGDLVNLDYIRQVSVRSGPEESIIEGFPMEPAVDGNTLGEKGGPIRLAGFERERRGDAQENLMDLARAIHGKAPLFEGFKEV